MKLCETFVVFVNLFILSKTIAGLKCYECHYWDGPDPSQAADLNHISCAQGNVPLKRFMKVCDPGRICASAHIEFLHSSSLKSITSRRCIMPDLLIHDKCLSIKSISDLDRLRKSSRILKFDKNDKIENGTECGCSSQLCNSGSLLDNSVMPILILTVHIIWISNM